MTEGNLQTIDFIIYENRDLEEEIKEVFKLKNLKNLSESMLSDIYKHFNWKVPKNFSTFVQDLKSYNKIYLKYNDDELNENESNLVPNYNDKNNDSSLYLDSLEAVKSLKENTNITIKPLEERNSKYKSKRRITKIWILLVYIIKIIFWVYLDHQMLK